MTATSKRALVWAPRALCILFAAFISLFALDAFSSDRDIWDNLVYFTMHLLPTFVLIGMLALAWRREWIGAVVSTLFGLWLAQLNFSRHNVVGTVIIAGPPFLMAALFLVNWLKRTELHTKP